MALQDTLVYLEDRTDHAKRGNLYSSIWNAMLHPLPSVEMCNSGIPSFAFAFSFKED